MITMLKIWWYVRRSKHNYSSVRQEAIEALGKLGDLRAVEPLIKALADGNHHIRCVAAEVLGKLGDPRAIEPLIQALIDVGSDVRTAAADAMAKLGEPKWKEWVTGDFRSYFERLGGSGDSRLVEPLLRGLIHGAPIDRLGAAMALGELGDRRAVEPLIKALADDSKHNIRGVAAEALGKLGDPRAFEPMVRVLGDSDWQIRCDAARALGKLGDPRAIEPLIAALVDVSEYVRNASTDALARLGEPKWKEWVRGDKEDFKRLGASEDSRAVEPLIRALSDMDESVLWGAAEALGKLRDRRAVEPLIKALGNWDPAVRQAAAEALANLGDPRSIKPLIDALADEPMRARRANAIAARVADPPDENGVVRQAAAMALGELGDARAVEPLVRALGDESGVRRAAAGALARLGEPKWQEWVKGDAKDFERLGGSRDSRAIEPLILALGDRRKHVRRAAAEALAEFASSCPTEIGKRWREVREVVMHPHNDLPGCGSSHADHGIGMNFPNPPPGMDF